VTRIVTSTYRYKPPPKRNGRKLAEITDPRILTIDPKTRTAKKSRRGVLAQGAAAEAKTRAPRSGVDGEATASSTTAQRVGAHDASVRPQPANDDGEPVKKDRRPSLRDGKAAAEDTTRKNPPGSDQAGEQQPNPPTTARKSAIITVCDRKTVQHKREQQQIAKLLQGEPKQSAIVTARKPRPWRSLEPDMTPEEHKRRGDAADAMFQEFKRLIAAGLKK
jgi:hypothetical protein